MSWTILFTRNALKQSKNMHEKVLAVLQLLCENLKSRGPAPGKNWRNYGKLYTCKNEDKRHCHLIKNKPTYVCCWQVDQSNKTIEIYYVGTHEKAPY